MTTQGATPRSWHLLPLSKTIVGPDNHTVIASFRNGADAALSHEAVNAHDRLQAEHEKVGELLDMGNSAYIFLVRTIGPEDELTRRLHVALTEVESAHEAVREARGE